MPNNSVEAYLRQKFGDIQLKPITFGGTNFVNLLDGAEPPRVAKIAGLNGAHIINEYHCLRYFSHCGLSEADWVLTHGDYGAHNILIDDVGGISVIDSGKSQGGVGSTIEVGASARFRGVGRVGESPIFTSLT